MAAKLIYIKTVSLLPKPNDAEEIKGVGRLLIEYSLCKNAAKLLRMRFIGNDIFVRIPTKMKVPTACELIHQVKYCGPPIKIFRHEMLMKADS